MKRLNAIVAAAAGMMLAGGILASCKGKEEAPTVRYLNFKPEVTEQYKQLAEEYEKLIVEKGGKP